MAFDPSGCAAPAFTSQVREVSVQRVMTGPRALSFRELVREVPIAAHVRDLAAHIGMSRFGAFRETATAEPTIAVMIMTGTATAIRTAPSGHAGAGCLLRPQDCVHQPQSDEGLSRHPA